MYWAECLLFFLFIQEWNLHKEAIVASCPPTEEHLSTNTYN